MSESELLASCQEYLDYLQALGKLIYWRRNSGMAYVSAGKKKYAIKLGDEGQADIEIIRWYEPEGAPNKGETIVTWIETKSETGVQSEAQKAFQKKVEAQGCRYFVVRDVKKLFEIVPQ